MADPGFDRAAFHGYLTTRWMGRHLIVRREVESTNDVAWDALAEGLPDGTTVVTGAQTRGRGRLGRLWHTAPGLGLALSVALHPGCDRRRFGVLPLVAGLALAEGLDRLGVRSRLKWPNDLLIGERKLAGILCESRRIPGGPGGGEYDAVVVGVGVNVSQRAQDFPLLPEPGSGATAPPTSLAIEGYDLTRERVAAGFLDALEPLWTVQRSGERQRVLERWSARADFWGRPVSVRTASGSLRGTARSLDPDGALVLALEGGTETTVVAGDLEVAWPPGSSE